MTYRTPPDDAHPYLRAASAGIRHHTRALTPSDVNPAARSSRDGREQRKGQEYMGWSTREVAQLAGTTLRAVRHYHEVGLLDLPERQPNGYKKYRTEHLV
ncbi:MerR family transcriptional regulator [Streptomyces nodosus]|uniref:MerR family transcriptional regulator n=1 Tax=Streptomyces nodosus TaxID=40318 RepID=UPI00178D0A4A|nr:MerR family transcriptional regulator [Streptomyces nodosus]MBB4789625.1 hypothetical protein [Streptomyces nodosus]